MSKLKVLKSILVAIVLMFAFLVTIPNARAVTITVDFDALDTSGTSTVSGVTLDNYLAGYGVTLTNITPGTSVYVGDQDNDINAIPSSGTNWLGQWWTGINGVSYQLDFDNVLDSLSFTRVGIPGLTSGTIAPEWSVTAYDAGNNSLGSYGEPLQSVWPSAPKPAQQFTFNAPGITHMVVYSNVHSTAGMGGMPIDDLVLEFSAEPVPEPATIALLGIGLAGLAGAEVRRRLKKLKQQ